MGCGCNKSSKNGQFQVKFPNGQVRNYSTARQANDAVAKNPGATRTK